MKLLHRLSLFPLAGAFVAVLAPFALAEDAPKADGKMPAVKVDPSPLPQVAGTLTTFAPVVEKVAPSVVTISRKPRPESDAQRPDVPPLLRHSR